MDYMMTREAARNWSTTDRWTKQRKQGDKR